MSGRFGFRGGFCRGTMAGSGCCTDAPCGHILALRPVEDGDGAEGAATLGFGSPQRGKDIEQSHLRYSRWQSEQPIRGEYQSRPHAKVVSVVVKLVREVINGTEMDSGRLVESYASKSSVCKGGIGTA